MRRPPAQRKLCKNMITLTSLPLAHMEKQRLRRVVCARVALVSRMHCCTEKIWCVDGHAAEQTGSPCTTASASCDCAGADLCWCGAVALQQPDSPRARALVEPATRQYPIRVPFLRLLCVFGEHQILTGTPDVLRKVAWCCGGTKA
jgi:hypothetical protein